MERDQAIARLKEHEAELKRLGVQHLYLFGSTARGDAREDSDVDLFFDYEQGELGLFELMDVKEAAEVIYDAVWSDPSDPSKTYLNAAQAVLSELKRRSGITQVFGPLQPLPH